MVGTGPTTNPIQGTTAPSGNPGAPSTSSSTSPSPGSGLLPSPGLTTSTLTPADLTAALGSFDPADFGLTTDFGGSTQQPATTSGAFGFQRPPGGLSDLLAQPVSGSPLPGTLAPIALPGATTSPTTGANDATPAAPTTTGSSNRVNDFFRFHPDFDPLDAQAWTPTSTTAWYTGLGVGSSSLVNGSLIASRDNIPFTQALLRQAPGQPLSVFRDLGLLGVNNQDIMANEYADVLAKGTIGTAFGVTTQELARRYGNPAVDNLVSRFTTRNAAPVPGSVAPRPGIRLDAPLSNGTFAGINFAVPASNLLMDKLLARAGLEDNYYANLLGDAGALCAGVAGPVSVALRKAVWPACYFPAGQSIAAGLITKPPPGINFGMVGDALRDTCSDENAIVDVLKQIVCQTGGPANPPASAPPAAGPGSAPAAPAAIAASPALVTAAAPAGGAQVARNSVITAPIPSSPPEAQPASAAPVTAAPAAAPVRYAPLPHGGQGVVVGEQQFAGTGNPRDVRGSATIVEDPATGDRYVSIQPSRVENPDGTTTVFIPRVEGTVVGRNPAGETALVVKLPAGASGRVTAQTPVDEVRVRTTPGSALEFNGGGDPLRSIPGMAYRSPDPGNARNEVWEIMPASRLDPNGKRTYTAQVPAGYEGRVDLAQSGIIRLTVPAGTRPVAVAKTVQEFTPVQPVVSAPVTSQAPRPAAVVTAPSPRPVVASPAPAPRPVTQQPQQVVRQQPAPQTRPVTQQPQPVVRPQPAPQQQPVQQPNLLQQGIAAAQQKAWEAAQWAGENIGAPLQTGFNQAMSTAEEISRNTIIEVKPFEGMPELREVGVMNGSRGVYDLHGNLVYVKDGNPPPNVPAWRLHIGPNGAILPGLAPGGAPIPIRIPVIR